MSSRLDRGGQAGCPIGACAGQLLRRQAFDVLEIGAAQVGFRQIGMFHVGAVKVGIVEIRLAQHRSAQIGPVQIGFMQVRILQVGTLQIGVVQVGTMEIGAVELGRRQRHPMQIGAMQVGISQERARKVPPVQIAAVQVGPLAHFPSRGDPGPMLLQHRAKLGSGDHVLARRLRCVPGSFGAGGPARLPAMSAWSLHHHSHCRARLFLAPPLSF
ncbi:hypothetical protein DF3PA_130032 [Candidatus Defluviicoccus seviourii]|uniref:Uncharacterized protein n=1 Tax=Candidatus Defluviicoccus seviourii TaxID=2565273 RepID=A0A564WDG2_9PROT|nr:hypothetical protein DF3PA_130032 [Candidatus Defluviicoccus seviourii]